MNPTNKQKVLHLGWLAVLMTVLSLAPRARANVYATNIKLNGSLIGASNSVAGPVTISFILNEAATRGTTIRILSGTNVVNTIQVASGNPGALRGTNSIVWGGTNSLGANVSSGNYTVSITTAATGYSTWTQTSVDSNTGNSAAYPWGIDVDKNTNSPYYGRVVMSCAKSTGAADPTRDGFYKMNADGSIADEGWFGNARYFHDDNSNDPAVFGQMPNSGGSNPGIIRIGEDDRIYWCDNTSLGAIMSCDIQATNFQVVITSGSYVNDFGYTSAFGGPHNYQNMPLISQLIDNGGFGIRKFDVSGLGTSNAAVYIVDTDGTSSSAGIWMYRLINGAADTNDTVGTQVVGQGPDFSQTGGGIMVDHHLNLFVGQSRGFNSDTHKGAFLYTNWNHGTLPPEGSVYAYAQGQENPSASPAPAWAVGNGDAYLTAIWDTVINSRDNPTQVAVCMDGSEASNAKVPGGFGGYNGGIRILSALNGSTLITNLDFANLYDGVAFDNVGNVYGCSRTSGKWRVWSPPGTNQATTVAVPTITIGGASIPITITSITVSGATVTIKFNASSSASASAFSLVSSPTVRGTYTTVSGATFSQISSKLFQVTATTSGASRFYRVYGP